MTVGLPGTGIGGFFYILSALLMPFSEVYRAIRYPHEPRRWRLAFRQFFIASGVLGSLSLIAWAVSPAAAPYVAAYSDRNVPIVVGISALALTLGVLATVLTSVQVLRLVVPRQPRRVAIPLPPPRRWRGLGGRVAEPADTDGPRATVRSD
jgi:hypothetical protein